MHIVNKKNKAEVEAIKRENSRVCALIDLDAIVYNMRAMHDRLDANTKMIAVVKADGYGHGAVPIAKALQKEEFLWGYATATVDEAIELRENGIKKPILILGYTFPNSYDELIKYEIRPAVFRYDQLEELNYHAQKFVQNSSSKLKIHIAVDTGMSRIGIQPDADGKDFVKKALNMSNIEVEGIFTHFAKADEADLSNARHKKDVFANFVREVEKENNVRIKIHHCANSAAIIGIDDAQMDMVRAGVTMYGMWPSNEVDKEKIKIKPALSLISHIVYIKTLEKGVQISYGGTYTTDKRTKVATIPVGYGDGYPRSLSSKGYVLIRGQKAKILGRVCMDQLMVDVTDIEGVSNFDEVVLIGNCEGDSITIEQLGDISGRFNYELACDLNQRIPRIYETSEDISSL